MNNPLSLFRRNHPALRTLSKIQDDFEKLFDQFGRIDNHLTTEFEFAPSCEMTEENSAYNLKIDMPGVKREDVKIDIDKNHVSISAERKAEKKSDTKKEHYSEITYGSYQRTFRLPVAIDENRAEAKFTDGVLMIQLPKAESTTTKRLPIQ